MYITQIIMWIMGAGLAVSVLAVGAWVLVMVIVDIVRLIGFL